MPPASPGDRLRSRAQDEPGRIPELVAEVACVLDPRRAEPLVVAGRGPVDDREAQGIGPELIDRAKWIDRVALGLGHLLAIRVPDQAGQVNGPDGTSPMSSTPSIIIRATQKKMMS